LGQRGLKLSATAAALLGQALEIQAGPLQRGPHRSKHCLLGGRVVVGAQDLGPPPNAGTRRARTILGGV
jgi:hypothetical protein